MGLKHTLVTATIALASTAAMAQDTVEIGVLKDSEMRVVQDILHPKDGATEIGFHVGWMPFDPLVTTPELQISFDKHLSEEVSVSVLVGGGYGMKTARYRELEEPPVGVAPYAFRYLASALAGVEWSPVYAKAALGGKKVVHFDIYGVARGGATLEQSVIPGGGITVAPTVSLGIGSRVFTGKSGAIRIEFRDDLMVQYRKATSSWNFKQNAGFTIGYSMFLGQKGARR